MEPQRLGSAAGGGIIGSLIGVLVSIWWLDSAPVGATVILCDGHWGGPRLRPGDSCLGVARRVAHVALVNLRQSLDLAQEFGDAVQLDLGGEGEGTEGMAGGVAAPAGRPAATRLLSW